MDERKRLTTGDGNDRFSPVPRTRGRKKVEPLVKKGNRMNRRMEPWDSGRVYLAVRFGIDLDLPRDTESDLCKKLIFALLKELYKKEDDASSYIMACEPVLSDGDTEFIFNAEERGRRTMEVIPHCIRHASLARTFIRRRGFVEQSSCRDCLYMDAKDFSDDEWMAVAMFVESRARMAVEKFCRDFRYVEVATDIEFRLRAGEDAPRTSKVKIASFKNKNTEALP